MASVDAFLKTLANTCVDMCVDTSVDTVIDMFVDESVVYVCWTRLRSGV